MLDYEIAFQERHDRFVVRVVAAREVWGLKSAAGWCVSASTKEEGGERAIMPFWSERASAQECAKEDWVDYEPATITLEEFLNSWLPGMAQDGVFVGTNWNADLLGMEIEPIKLREELVRALQGKA